MNTQYSCGCGSGCRRGMAREGNRSCPPQSQAAPGVLYDALPTACSSSLRCPQAPDSFSALRCKSASRGYGLCAHADLERAKSALPGSAGGHHFFRPA